MANVAADPVVRNDYPALWRAASQQLRNMATVGGNLLQRTGCPYFREAMSLQQAGAGQRLRGPGRHRPWQRRARTSAACTAAYAGDWAVALVAFDAVIDVVGG